MIELDHLSPQEQSMVEHLVDAIEQSDGVRPTNESADLVIAGRRPGSFLLATSSQQVVGFAVIDSRDATIQVGVAPEHRRQGHGTALLETALLAHPGYAVWAFGTGEGAAALAASLVLRPVRELLQMTRPLGDETEPQVPTGWTIRSYQDSDAEAIVSVNAAAFAHHPEQGKLTLAEFTDLTRQPWFSPEGLLVATPAATGAVAGFHWTKRHDRATGEVYVLAVHPEHSGHGLGRVLLESGLAHLSTIGCSKVMLFVEASENRVVELYRSASFVISNTDTSYRR